MIHIFSKRTVKIARVLLIIWFINLLQPLGAYALTSGPSQPEVQSFQPIGESDMVDMLSGDFKYNIPLMDVDGYPVNLNYQSGVGMEDEASWVGLGWNLNVGSINRQVRGVADDFAGDVMKTDHFVKPKITVGGKISAKMEFRGRYGKLVNGNSVTVDSSVVKGPRISGTLSLGVFNDNYTGIGAEIGANAGISFGLSNDGAMTAGLGIGVLSSTSSGVDVSPSMNLSIYEEKNKKLTSNAGFSSNLGYNTRSGMKSLGFGQTYKSASFQGPSIFFNTEPILPKVQIPYTSYYGSVSLDAGLTLPLLYFGGGVAGYVNVRKVAQENLTNPAYGFLYAEKGKNKANAMMDFIREKENPVIKEMPNLALPVSTPDIWTYNSQAGSGQFRLYRGGTGAYFDTEVKEKSDAFSVGGDLGFGIGKHFGITAFYQHGNNTTRKWTDNNAYLRNGDFQDESGADPRYQNVFFRNIGELNIEDDNVAGKIAYNKPLSIQTSATGALSSFKVENDFYSNTNKVVDSAIVKKKRQLQKTMISYLNAKDASHAALDTMIYNYKFNEWNNFTPPSDPDLVPKPWWPGGKTYRTEDFRKPHHISEITVNENGGQKAVYGYPVYNTLHEEYSYAIGKNATRTPGGYAAEKGLVAVNSSGVERGKGIDQYYHKESQPPYAYAYMLSGILSPDYQDKTGNGISPDDNGTAIQFKYSKITDFGWRTPFNNKFTNGSEIKTFASLNRGLLADPDDDKASIVYGRKEIAYVNSIESKTKIAYFITEDREDALGVTNVGGDEGGPKQKRLREIRLYSKMDMSKPIKVVKFEYRYDLCPSTPNSRSAEKGKLTLVAVWFEYGNTSKGANHKYEFNYKKGVNNGITGYESLTMDRWGAYKDPAVNPAGFTNEEYPYSDQVKSRADTAAGLWNLTAIKLPSGGEIGVSYEADDYAYVQDKQATVMRAFSPNNGANNSLENSTGIFMKLSSLPLANSAETPLQWFKENYLNGSNYIYTKTFVKIGPANDDFDMVPAYCKVQNVVITDSTANIIFEPVNEAGLAMNPIRFAAWQRMKNDYPRYAYPGFQNRVGDDSNTGVKAVFAAIGSAANNLAELKENFYQKAQRKHFASEIKVGRSFARITQVSGFKIGGGSRVKKITVNDHWDELSGTSPGGIYGQSYDYTTIRDGKKISSGVATYEPAIGNDENPLKQPVPYMQKIKGAINSYFELEEPFGESFFPGPSVGYSKVTVRDLDATGSAPDFPKTGLSVYEFYTAKDFPVKVTVMPIVSYNPTPERMYYVVATNSIEQLTLSQGYSIELNDMHGKSKAARTFNQSGNEVSSTEYQYQVDDPGAVKPTLNNKVTIVDEIGELHPNKIMGRDIDFFTDFREQESSNIGVSANPGVDLLPIFQIPIPHIPINTNTEFKLFRSACAVKVVQSSGILSKVIKKQDGSSITVENLAYDGLTGEAVLTRTQNEFKKDYYSLNLPAYWPYKHMGGAYQTLGIVLKDVALNEYKEINDAYWDVVTEGDELINTVSGEHFWVMNKRPLGLSIWEIQEGKVASRYTKSLINRNGQRVTQIAANQNVFKVVKSAYRNQLGASLSSLVSLKYPVKDNKIILSQPGDLSNYQILSASAGTFDELWPTGNCGQTNNKFENTTMVFTFKNAFDHQYHGQSGARIYNPCGDSGEGEFRSLVSDTDCGDPLLFNNNALNRRLQNVGIWLNEGNTLQNLNRWIGVRSTFTTEANQSYYIGYAGDDGLNVTIDGIQLSTVGQTLNFWSIKPLPLNIQSGTHTILIEGYNISNATSNTEQDNPGSMGVEIYRNSASGIVHANTESDLGLVFSTKWLLADQSNLQTYRSDAAGNKIWRFTYDSYYNPFVQGLYGNWRPSEQFVFQTNRKYTNVFGQTKGIDAKNAGTFQNFFTLMSYDGYDKRWGMTANPGTSIGWKMANKVTAYDKYGQELENKDALGRNSAALFDFNGLLPGAVASNALNREIYFNSFEDTRYRTTHTVECSPADFNLLGNSTIDDIITTKTSHSGMTSLNLNNVGIKMNTQIHDYQLKSNYYLLGSDGQYTLNDAPGLFLNGFEPFINRTYIVNFWLKDEVPTQHSAEVSGSFKQGQSVYPLNFACKAIVEGWKLMEGRMPIYNMRGQKLEISIYNSGSSQKVYVDDIRIHPEKALLKTFAYNPRTFKLMAEMDENAFATFYEYDDEGSLVRVKKETERGIVTLKESRSAYRKKLGLLN